MGARSRDKEAMAIPSTPNDSSDNAHDPEKVLADWLKATTDFYAYYQQLVTLINQQGQLVRFDSAGIPYLGQCPVGSLINLVETMQAELEKLVSEMDQMDELKQANVNQYLSQLMNHIHRLKQLNRKARVYLELASASSS